MRNLRGKLFTAKKKDAFFISITVIRDGGETRFIPLKIRVFIAAAGEIEFGPSGNFARLAERTQAILGIDWRSDDRLGLVGAEAVIKDDVG